MKLEEVWAAVMHQEEGEGGSAKSHRHKPLSLDEQRTIRLKNRVRSMKRALPAPPTFLVHHDLSPPTLSRATWMLVSLLPFVPK